MGTLVYLSIKSEKCTNISYIAKQKDSSLLWCIIELAKSYEKQNDSFSLANGKIINFYLNNLHPDVYSIFNFISDTEYEFLSNLSKLKASSSDNVTIKVTVLILCCPFSFIYLLHIINLCLERFQFPSFWKLCICCCYSRRIYCSFS